MTEPIVYMRGAVSLTTLPMARITAEITPGSAEGNTTLKIVRTFPAPKANEPSRNESGTDFKLSSVERIIVGSSIMLIVKPPATMLEAPPNHTTKVSMPNRP